MEKKPVRKEEGQKQLKDEFDCNTSHLEVLLTSYSCVFYALFFNCLVGSLLQFSFWLLRTIDAVLQAIC